VLEAIEELDITGLLEVVPTERAGSVTVLVVLGNKASLSLDVDSLVVVITGLYSTLAVVESTRGDRVETETAGWDVVTVLVTADATLLALTAATFCSSICRCLSRSASVSFCRICFCSSGPASGDVATSVDSTVAVISGELPVRVSWSTSRARSMPAMLVDTDEVGTSLDTPASAAVYKTPRHAIASWTRIHTGPTVLVSLYFYFSPSLILCLLFTVVD